MGRAGLTSAIHPAALASLPRHSPAPWAGTPERALDGGGRAERIGHPAEPAAPRPRLDTVSVLCGEEGKTWQPPPKSSSTSPGTHVTLTALIVQLQPAGHRARHGWRDERVSEVFLAPHLPTHSHPHPRMQQRPSPTHSCLLQVPPVGSHGFGNKQVCPFIHE